MSAWIDKVAKSNKIYILPNRFGSLYFFVIFIMILTGATYSNNLIYLLGFFLFSVFSAGMVQTHNNLKGLLLKVIRVEDSHEGDMVRVIVELTNSTKNIKQTIRVQLYDKDLRQEIPAKFDILHPHKSMTAELLVKAPKRGEYKLGRLKLYTNFPLGLFVAWLYEVPDNVSYFVYPKNKDFNSKFQLYGEEKKKKKRRLLSVQSDNDFKEHKRYQVGESHRHIDWKVYARKRLLLVKAFDGESGEHRVFRYHELKHLNFEQRLQQLTYWISFAKKGNHNFRLDLPNRKVSFGSGTTHVQRCLRELAIFEEGSTRAS